MTQNKWNNDQFEHSAEQHACHPAATMPIEIRIWNHLSFISQFITPMDTLAIVYTSHIHYSLATRFNSHSVRSLFCVCHGVLVSALFSVIVVHDIDNIKPVRACMWTTSCCVSPNMNRNNSINRRSNPHAMPVSFKCFLLNFFRTE